tara:strand:- start:387 stop:710 length:324 start_codon:yes stop_codon:yes gene_type:complete
MKANDLMLIFKVADDNTAMLPLSTLHQIDGGTGSIVLTFGGSQTDDDLANPDIDVITLATGADEFEACKDLVRKFNEGPHSDGALVVADEVAKVYCSSTITALTSIL